MDEKLHDYLKKIQNKMKETETQFIAYIKDGRKLVSIGNSINKKGINKKITDYIDKYGYNEGDKFIVVFYSFTYTIDGPYGPMFMACEIRIINAKGKFLMKDFKSNAIHYTVSELKKRGFKRGDYKRLFNKLNNGTINSELKTVYTAKHLD
jgi:hypothetical protein